MKKIYKWSLLIVCIFIFSSCSKKAEVEEVSLEVEDSKDSEVIEENNMDENSVNDDSRSMIAAESIEELSKDKWIQDESILVAKDKSFVVYKRWMDEIDSKEFELYIWQFSDEPVLIKEAVGLVQGYELSPNEKQMIIYMGTSSLSNGLVYDIEKKSIVTQLNSIDLALWSPDSEKIIARRVTETLEDSEEGYNESLIYWHNTMSEAIEFISGKYSIHFENLESSESDIKVQVVYPLGEPIDLMIAYDLIASNNYPNLYSVDPYKYIQAMIAFNDSLIGNSGLITDEYAIYWDMNKNALVMWTLKEGETIIDKDMGTYSEFSASPNQRYIAMTFGTSAARELILVDSKSKSIIYRIGTVFDTLFWSLDNQYLAFNILNDKIINPSLEIDQSMDVGVLYIEDLSGKRIANGTQDHYVLVEGFTYTGLDVYEADKEFQKTKGYTISYEDIRLLKDTYKSIGEEESFESIVFEFENEYATKRVNDGITALNDFYIKKGYETKLEKGYDPVSSTIVKYTVDKDFISLFFTYTYQNPEGIQKNLYDSLTYHTKDGVLISFDLMFKAEEIENVFGQMLKDEITNSGVKLIKEFQGFTDEAKFYFVEDGIIVYYSDGLYSAKGQGPLYVKLLWKDLEGLIETDNLVY